MWCERWKFAWHDLYRYYHLRLRTTIYIYDCVYFCSRRKITWLDVTYFARSRLNTSCESSVWIHNVLWYKDTKRGRKFTLLLRCEWNKNSIHWRVVVIRALCVVNKRVTPVTTAVTISVSRSSSFLATLSFEP